MARVAGPLTQISLNLGSVGGVPTLLGRAQGLFGVTWGRPRQRRERPEQGGTLVSTDLGARQFSAVFVCDDTLVTNELLFGRSGRRYRVVVYPEGVATGKPTISGQAILTIGWVAQYRAGRLFSCNLLMDGSPIEGVAP